MGRANQHKYAGMFVQRSVPIVGIKERGVKSLLESQGEKILFREDAEVFLAQLEKNFIHNWLQPYYLICV